MATKKANKKTAKKRTTASKSKGRTTKRSAGRGTATKRKTAARSGGAKKSARGGQGNAAFMQPMTPSAALGAVVGENPIPRTEVVKRLWAYIRKNKLQDTKNRRNINADDRLSEVFNGKKQVSMFEMTKLVKRHLKAAS